MKKIISRIMIAVMALTLMTSCTSKVEIESDAIVVLVYEHNGTSVSSTLTGNNAALVINTLNGAEITDEAPEGAEYVEGVYFMVGSEFFHVDLNGSPVFMIGDYEGYVEIEQFRFDAVIAQYQQFGIRFN